MTFIEPVSCRLLYHLAQLLKTRHSFLFSERAILTAWRMARGLSPRLGYYYITLTNLVNKVEIIMLILGPIPSSFRSCKNGNGFHIYILIIPHFTQVSMEQKARWNLAVMVICMTGTPTYAAAAKSKGSHRQR